MTTAVSSPAEALLSPTLAALSRVAEEVQGRPEALTAAARRWDAVGQQLAGVAQQLTQAKGRADGAGLRGHTRDSFDHTASELPTWVGAVSRRHTQTAESLRTAAHALTLSQESLAAVRAAFVNEATNAVAAQLAVPGPDALARAARVVGPLGDQAIDRAREVVTRLSESLRSVAGQLDLQGQCTTPSGTPHSFVATVLGAQVPTQWLPEDRTSPLIDTVWPPDDTRKFLAVGSSLANLGPETVRQSFAYARNTLAASVIRNLTMDTSAEFADAVKNPLANATNHALWAALFSYGTEGGMYAATKGLHAAGWLSPDTKLYTGVGNHLAATNAITSGLLALKDPALVGSGLAYYDLHGHAQPIGAWGHAASIGYDIGAISTPATAIFGMESYYDPAKIALGINRRSAFETACAEALTNTGGVLFGHALGDNVDAGTRLTYLAGSGGAIYGAIAYCPVIPGGGGEPPMSGMSPATVPFVGGDLGYLPGAGMAPAPVGSWNGQWRWNDWGWGSAFYVGAPLAAVAGLGLYVLTAPVSVPATIPALGAGATAAYFGRL